MLLKWLAVWWKTRKLTKALNDPNEQVRLDAAAELGKLGAVKAVEPLIRFAEKACEGPNSDELARRATRDALVAIGKPAVPKLFARMGTQNACFLADVLQVLARIRDDRLQDVLLGMLKGGSPQLRALTGPALQEMEYNEDFVDGLIQLLANEDDPFVAEVIAGGLRSITGARGGPDAARWRTWRDGKCTSCGGGLSTSSVVVSPTALHDEFSGWIVMCETNVAYCKACAQIRAIRPVTPVFQPPLEMSDSWERAHPDATPEEYAAAEAQMFRDRGPKIDNPWEAVRAKMPDIRARIVEVVRGVAAKSLADSGAVASMVVFWPGEEHG